MQYLVQPMVSDAASAPGTGEHRYYTLMSLASGHVLAAAAGKAAGKAAAAVQERWTEAPHQQWRFVGLANGRYKVESRADGHVLTVAPPSPGGPAAVTVQPWTGGPGQQWRVIHEPHGQIRLEAVHGGMVLAVPSASNEDGKPLTQEPETGAPAQTWLASEVRDIDVLFADTVTVHAGRDFQGTPIALGPGSYILAELGLDQDRLASLRVPPGLRVTLYEQDNFRGPARPFTGDAAHVGDDWEASTAALLVEKVVTLHAGGGFTGPDQAVGVGRYRLADLAPGFGGAPGSLRLPQGLMVILYEHDDFRGRRRVLFEDLASLDEVDFDLTDASLIVKIMGIVIPSRAVQFGARIALRAPGGSYLAIDPDQTASVDVDHLSEQAKLTLVRVGNTKHNNLVSYGDVVALRRDPDDRDGSNQGRGSRYLRVTGEGDTPADGQEGDPWTRLVVVRAGPTMHQSFVSLGDRVGLRALVSSRYLTTRPSGALRATGGSLGDRERFEIAWLEPPPTAAVGAPARQAGGGLVTGWADSPAGTCGGAACGADLCGVAACNTAAELVSSCTAAAMPLAVCAAEAACGAGGPAGVCGVAVGGITAGALSACGADACGGAACGGAACATAACGAAACGADLCGAAASPLAVSVGGACVVAIGGLDACAADACGGNICGVNLCPADACAADACAIDLIPIVPFI